MRAAVADDQLNHGGERMADASAAINYVLGNENGFVDNKNDPGGATNHGISLRFIQSLPNLKKYGLQDATRDTIEQLTQLQAFNILLNEFWHNTAFALISDQNVCDNVFDMSVAQGTATAIKALQRAIWAVFGDIDLAEDGVLGKITLRWVEFTKPETLLAAFRAERAWVYRQTVAEYPRLKGFLPAWLARAYSK